MIDLQQLIVIILGSSLVATLATKIFDWFGEKSKKKEEEQRRIYGPLKFYLQIMQISEIGVRNEFIKRIQKYTIEKNNGFMLFSDIFIEKWMNYLARMVEVLETNPSFMKKKDIFVFSMFVEHYIQQKIDDENWWQGLFMILDRLRKEVK